MARLSNDLRALRERVAVSAALPLLVSNAVSEPLPPSGDFDGFGSVRVLLAADDQAVSRVTTTKTGIVV